MKMKRKSVLQTPAATWIHFAAGHQNAMRPRETERQVKQSRADRAACVSMMGHILQRAAVEGWNQNDLLRDAREWAENQPIPYRVTALGRRDLRARRKRDPLLT